MHKQPTKSLRPTAKSRSSTSPSPKALKPHLRRSFSTTPQFLVKSTPFKPKSPRFTALRQMSTHDDSTPANEVATLGIGCYWGTEHYYRKQFASKFPDSVLDIKVGFMGGKVTDPTYRQVCDGETGHVEVAQIIFNPAKATYEDVLKFSFGLHDSTTPDRQGGDAGTQYASVIFYHSDAQHKIAEQLKAKLQAALTAKAIQFKRAPFENNTVTTKILPASQFYPAHEAHQMYLIKNPDGYCNHAIRFVWDEQIKDE